MSHTFSCCRYCKGHTFCMFNVFCLHGTGVQCRSGVVRQPDVLHRMSYRPGLSITLKYGPTKVYRNVIWPPVISLYVLALFEQQSHVVDHLQL